MLNMKQFFDAICLYKRTTLPKLADELGMSMPALYRRATGVPEKTQIGELENIVHKCGYRLRIELVDDKDKVLFFMTSDRERPMVTDEILEEKRAGHVRSTSAAFLDPKHKRGGKSKNK